MESETTVVNVRTDDYDVYIGRANPRYGLQQSKWHNPFTITRFISREHVIAQYKAYILCRPDLLAALPELRGKRLACWCTPQSCHGDILVELLNAL